MTVIAAVVHDGGIVIGGDSAGVAGWDLTVRADPKVFELDGWVFGFTTSYRMGDLLRYRLTIPRRHDDDPLDRWIRVDFIDAIRTCLTDGGWKRTDSGRDDGGTFICGHAGRLFVIDSDFQVGEPADGYAAVGCGNQAALGALHATQHLQPAQRVGAALAAAERHSAGVRGPFHLVSLDAPREPGT